MDVSKIGGHSPLTTNNIRINKSALENLIGNNTGQNQGKTLITSNVTVDISEEARKKLKGHNEHEMMNPLQDDLMKLKMNLQNNTDGKSEAVLFEEFMQKCNEYKENGIFDNQGGDITTNQILQNSILDLVDEYSAKAVNDMCQSDLKAMSLRTKMAMSLVNGLGITSGHVDLSEKGIAKMMELYKQKLKDGTLNSPYAEIRSLDDFDKYFEKYNKDIESATKEYDTYSLLVQKFEEIKDSFVQLFKGNKDKF